MPRLETKTTTNRTQTEIHRKWRHKRSSTAPKTIENDAETIENGVPSTRFMQPGDHIRFEMFDEDGGSIFGAIDQRVV